MARFYGEVVGRRRTVHRLGDRQMCVTAASYRGAIQVEIRPFNGCQAREEYRVVEINWPGRSVRRVVQDWRQL